MKKINCLGDYCPMPLIKTKAALRILPINESILLVTDHSCVVESIKDYFTNTSVLCVFDEVLNGVWEITLTKT
ncbi:MAG: sulfurtransferase TusA family protein [Firmicutes bacterium HGW-Firmicutes-7]|nr:MAG: sulfurtransferase TusA family protein [Firmicutes bacterium HGW-Firmicutes-7]